jgi:Holliday junction resolvase RusA-like endonuclease
MIRLSVPGLPPSINDFYFTFKKGKATIRAISKDGRAYKKLTLAHLAQEYPAELATIRKDMPYLIVVKLFFKALHNKSWPETAKTRYKRLDGTNRIKVFEDVLADASGIDDSQNLTFIVEKRECDTEKPHTEVWMWNTEEEESPFDEVLYELEQLQPH